MVTARAALHVDAQAAQIVVRHVVSSPERRSAGAARGAQYASDVRSAATAAQRRERPGRASPASPHRRHGLRLAPRWVDGPRGAAHHRDCTEIPMTRDDRTRIPPARLGARLERAEGPHRRSRAHRPASSRSFARCRATRSKSPAQRFAGASRRTTAAGRAALAARGAERPRRAARPAGGQFRPRLRRLHGRGEARRRPGWSRPSETATQTYGRPDDEPDRSRARVLRRSRCATCTISGTSSPATAATRPARRPTSRSPTPRCRTSASRFIVIAGAILGPHDLSLYWQRYLFRAYRRGRRAAQLTAVPYEELLPLPLAEVRRRLAIEPPSVAHPEGILVASRGEEPRWRIGDEPSMAGASLATAGHTGCRP